MDEAGVAYGLESATLSLCGVIGNSEGTACKPTSEPSTKVGRGLAGTVNTEVARESLAQEIKTKIPAGTSRSDVQRSTGHEFSKWSIAVVNPISKHVLAKILKNRQGSA